jgi:hypothetical protein
MRAMAQEAKRRLCQNDYSRTAGALAPPKDVTPSQRTVYIKLRELFEAGEDVINPVQQLADKEKLASLSHEERQRYILQLSADYVSMRRALDDNIQKSKRA